MVLSVAHSSSKEKLFRGFREQVGVQLDQVDQIQQNTAVLVAYGGGPEEEEEDEEIEVEPTEEVESD